MNPDALLFAVVVTTLFVTTGWVARRWREHRQAAAAEKAVAAWRATQPPVIEPAAERVAQLRAALPGLALPVLELVEAKGVAITRGGTRIGGPVWLPEGRDWPAGRDGQPLEFVAQVDFADLPPLPDYPARGLLQLFIGSDDLFGADLDSPARGDIRLVWSPDGASGGALRAPPRLPGPEGRDDHGTCNSPFVDAAVRAEGVALAASAVRAMPPYPHDWPVQRLCRSMGIDVRSMAIAELLEALEETAVARPPCHHVGGHPAFTQWDYRGVHEDAAVSDGEAASETFADVDRVLFQLGSETGLMWGDAGVANVMIRRDDLVACRFERAVWWWDCG